MAISTTAVTIWGGLAALAGVLGFLWRKVWPALRRFSHFVDDFVGEEERPGVPARPGVLERLQTLEEALAEVRYHVQPNGGRSAHDRLVARVDAMAALLNEHMTDSTASHRALWGRIDALTRKEDFDV